jgi:hypothetical protein
MALENNKPKSLNKISTDSNKTGEKKQKKSPIHKKPIFWIVIVLSALLLGLLVFISVYFINQTKNQKTVTSGWSDIAKESNVLNDLASKIQDQASFDIYNTELKKYSSLVADKKALSEKLKFAGNDVKRYQNFLNDYGSYVDFSKEQASNINDFSQEASDKLKDKVLSARTSADELKNNEKYIKQEMPAAAFQIQDALLQANKVILENELTSKTKQLAQAAATAKDASDKQKNETLANNFLNAYLAGNAPLIRQYMTDGFQKEYDYNQLAPSARTYVYPASFRILSTLKIDDTHYKVQANVLFRAQDGTSQYTLGQELNNIFDTTTSRWLVNNLREGNSF